MADDDLEQSEDGEDLVPRSHIRQLESKAKKVDDLEQQLTNLQREAAFARALGNLDHPGLSYFQKGYDGPLDVDAIRNAAREAGFIRTTPEGTPPPDTSATDRIAEASEGAKEPPPADLTAAIAAAQSEDEVLDLLEQAAARGENVPVTTRSLQ